MNQNNDTLKEAIERLLRTTEEISREIEKIKSVISTQK